VIDRQDGKIVWECDSCEETFSWPATGDGAFKEGWAAAKAEGWRTRKVGDEWVHGCERCGV
jgi:hypothetical protein